MRNINGGRSSMPYQSSVLASEILVQPPRMGNGVRQWPDQGWFFLGFYFDTLAPVAQDFSDAVRRQIVFGSDDIEILEQTQRGFSEG